MDIEKLTTQTEKDQMTPLYYQVQEQIRATLISGRYAVGNKIPSEKELEEHFKVSRITIRKAVEALVQEGLLIKKRGIGTIVAQSQVEDQTNVLIGFTEKMSQKGIQVSTQVLEAKIVCPDDQISQYLALEPHEKTLRIKRLRFIENRPIGIVTAYVPEKHGITLDEDFSGSMFALYEKYNLIPYMSERTLYAINLNQEEANLLDMKKDAAALCINYLTIDHKGVPLEFAEGIWHGDEYIYKVNVMRDGIDKNGQYRSLNQKTHISRRVKK